MDRSVCLSFSLSVHASLSLTLFLSLFLFVVVHNVYVPCGELVCVYNTLWELYFLKKNYAIVKLKHCFYVFLQTCCNGKKELWSLIVLVEFRHCCLWSFLDWWIRKDHIMLLRLLQLNEMVCIECLVSGLVCMCSRAINRARSPRYLGGWGAGLLNPGDWDWFGQSNKTLF